MSVDELPRIFRRSVVILCNKEVRTDKMPAESHDIGSILDLVAHVLFRGLEIAAGGPDLHVAQAQISAGASEHLLALRTRRGGLSFVKLSFAMRRSSSAVRYVVGRSEIMTVPRFSSGRKHSLSHSSDARCPLPTR